MSFAESMTGAVVVAPMTKGSNLPFRRMCVELGARVLVSEMVVARRLKQKRRSEFALIRRAPDEPLFAVQLAGTNPEEMAWAAALAQSRGADFVDVNLGCPIDHFTRKGLGAALARQPRRVARIVEAMAKAVTVPVTVKIRLGWNEKTRNHLEVAQAAVDGGAQAVFVHGRTREARYRSAADWDAVGEVAAALGVPVIGNGDILWGHDAEAFRQRAGCAGVMAGRGALINPFLFREAREGWRPVSAADRLEAYARYVALAGEHWGEDEHGRTRARDFLVWHLGFWCRYVPRRADGTWPTLQQRESSGWATDPMDALLARADVAAHEWLADRLLAGEVPDPAQAPPPAEEPPSHQRDEDNGEVSG